uniref:Uncharacterized protein n=1 Tax=Pararge aegeria TaxID=116150 RepID=S4PYY0_9NEOP
MIFRVAQSTRLVHNIMVFVFFLISQQAFYCNVTWSVITQSKMVPSYTEPIPLLVSTRHRILPRYAWRHGFVDRAVSTVKTT